MKSRSPVQCLHRWTKILKPGLTKGPWIINEDKKLKEWVRMEGPNKWSQCAEFILGRSGKQCRERWFNTLNPQVKKGNWDIEEDYNIFYLFSLHGSKWSKIALSFPGRTENSVKNRFYSTLRRIASNYKKGNDDEKTNSLESLLKYYPEAFEEKKKQYLLNKQDLKTELLGKKVERFPSSKTTQSTCSKTLTEYNLSSFEELEHMISNYSSENIVIEKCIKERVFDSKNNESVKSLINHLNELESILLSTKNQLVNIDRKNVDESKIDNLFTF
jgi:hypothetical protein